MFGEQKTPESFRQACKRFIYTENLVAVLSPEVGAAGSKGARPAVAPRQPLSDGLPFIEAALSQMEDNDGWFTLGAVGQRLLALKPDFGPRTYGCASLALLIERSQAFGVRRDGRKVDIRPATEVGSDVV